MITPRKSGGWPTSQSSTKIGCPRSRFETWESTNLSSVPIEYSSLNRSAIANAALRAKMNPRQVSSELPQPELSTFDFSPTRRASRSAVLPAFRAQGAISAVPLSPHRRRALAAFSPSPHAAYRTTLRIPAESHPHPAIPSRNLFRCTIPTGAVPQARHPEP